MTPTSSEPSSQPVPARGRPDQRLAYGGTELVFSWSGDRWRHHVNVHGRTVAESVEAGPDERWPASPPLVDLSAATIAGRPSLLAVGLAGRSHFSASILPHPTRPDTLLFEIACRIRESAPWLGSTYAAGPNPADRVRIAPPADATAGLPRTVQWSYTIGPDGIAAVTG